MVEMGSGHIWWIWVLGYMVDMGIWGSGCIRWR